MQVNILHLYYDIMNLYGEYANCEILKKHLIDQGIDTTIDHLSINDDIDFTKYEFIYVGSSTERNQIVCLKHLLKYKEAFEDYIENYGFVLMTGNSYEMLGKSINEENALGILSFTTNTVKDRRCYDIIMETEWTHEPLVGFINNMSVVNNNVYPFGKVTFGKGENDEDLHEGVKYKNTYGTHLIGPLLVKNPSFLKYLVKEIAYKMDEDFVYKDIDYKEEEEAYKITFSELSKRKDSQK